MFMTIQQMRRDAEDIFRNAVRAVDPFEAVKRTVLLDGKDLLVSLAKGGVDRINLPEVNRIFLVGGGKATAPMAKAMEQILGQRITKGIVIVKYGFAELLAYVEVIEAGHPLPDQEGLKGTKRILELLAQAGEKDLIFSLISGGGSALLPCPADDITLEEKQTVTEMLLDCGASIDEMNAVRKHISCSKGGQMARAAFPAKTINLMLSDVVGDNMDVIASGPFVPDASTFKTALDVFRKYGLQGVPSRVEHYLQAGVEGKVPETPKQDDPIFDRVQNIIVGSNMLALEAAETRARELGYNSLILSSMVEGETREVAKVHAAIAKEIVKTGRPVPAPACIISGGETTVTIRGQGLGGRNQEFCLAAAIELKGLSAEVVMLSGGTDGNDGPTDAAGGLVDTDTLKRSEEKGLDSIAFLQNNDAYHFLQQTGDLLITGPTRTNVMDVRLILVK